MAATANRGQQIISRAKLHRRYDVGNIHAPRNETWAFIDHPVIDFARGLIGGIRGLNKLPAERTLQLIYRLCRHRILPITVMFDSRSNEPKTTLATLVRPWAEDPLSRRISARTRESRKVYQFPRSLVRVAPLRSRRRWPRF